MLLETAQSQAETLRRYNSGTESWQAGSSVHHFRVTLGGDWL